MAFLSKEQTGEGAWFGRWGTNYVYGTWSVLTAFAHAGIGPEDEAVRRAVNWLVGRQNSDGGWGESNDSYAEKVGDRTPSTPHQTAWAVLGLIAAGQANSVAVSSGVEYLLRTQQTDGLWTDT